MAVGEAGLGVGSPTGSAVGVTKFPHVPGALLNSCKVMVLD